jgi:ribosomal protein S13
MRDRKIAADYNVDGSRRIRYLEHVACLKGLRYFEDLAVNGSIILKCT